jgi:Mrp family chromosome partitioning ATPase
MLSLALLTPNSMAAEGIEQLAQESGLFKIVFKASPESGAAGILRSLKAHDPEIILLDIGDREPAALVAQHIHEALLRGVVVAFGSGWSQTERRAFAEVGIHELVPDPFSAAELEAAAYEALHRERPVTHKNILAFLPAKAGGGCSTVTLNTAAALSRDLSQRTLLIEADRRSGVLSIMLDLHPGRGLAEALAHAGEMTAGEWHEYYQSSFGMHLLLADPANRGSFPSWADYYQILHFVQKQYDFVFIDLPEIVNQASAELVRSARGVFVVCTPEVPSLKMAGYRCAELEACEIPPGNIHIVLNRWETDRLSIRGVEDILGRPVFGTLPNDYSHVTGAIMESQLVAPETGFAESCRQLAQKLSGLPDKPQAKSKFDLLLKLGRLSS